MKRLRQVVKKEVRKSVSLRNYLEPLLILPYVFLGIYVYENGFNILSAVIGLLLLVIVPAVLVAFREEL